MFDADCLNRPARTQAEILDGLRKPVPAEPVTLHGFKIDLAKLSRLAATASLDLSTASIRQQLDIAEALSILLVLAKVHGCKVATQRSPK